MKDSYLDFKEANCKNCYRCLRSCPVKAIEVIDHQARIIEKRCILCGTCTQICPQDAKAVHSQKQKIMSLVSGVPVLASVAPSFVSSFGIDFAAMREMLVRLGFAGAYETAEGAAAVVWEYEKLLKSGKYKNFITSACPAVNRLVQQYYPKCLPYLAEVDTPAIAHAKMLKNSHKGHMVVFIGPCIAKKREGAESGVIDGVLTFEELNELFTEHGISAPPVRHAFDGGEVSACHSPSSASDTANRFDGGAVPACQSPNSAADTANRLDGGAVSACQSLSSAANIANRFDGGAGNPDEMPNKARFFPIARGIIKSFEQKLDNYEYIAVEGVNKCVQALEGIDGLSGVFLELNACDYGCVNGPCSLQKGSGKIVANSTVRRYASRNIAENQAGMLPKSPGLDLFCPYPKLNRGGRQATQQEITAILHKTEKYRPSDELNCGACGYESCREKAWAVINGYADIEMCVPYMRERAESMSYEVIKSSPNGIIVVDSELKIVEINDKARELWGITQSDIKGKNAADYFDITDFFVVLTGGKDITRKKTDIKQTQKHIELTIKILSGHKILFCICNDITEEAEYEKRLDALRAETFLTTDAVIKKQMRIAQEIASLLGETTAETKVALHKLKTTLKEGEAKDK